MPVKKKIADKADKRRRGKVVIPGVEKPIYVSGRTQKEVEEAKRKVRESFIHGVRIHDRPFVEVIIDWFENIKKPGIKTNSTLNNWRSTINTHIIPYFHPKKLTSAVTRKDLQDCLDELEGMNKTVAVQARSVLRGACQFAVVEGIIIRDPSLLLHLPEPKTIESKDYLTPYQEQTLLEVAARHEHGLLIQLLYYLGCRKGEALGLKWSDINWQTKTVQIVRDIDLTTPRKHPKHVGDLKTEASDRTVPLPDALISILKPLRGLPDHFIITNAKESLTANQCAQRWNTIMLECGFARYNEHHSQRTGNVFGVDNDFTPHWLRHHYVTSCVMAGLRPEITMMIVGHADYQTTISVYTHLMHDGEFKKTMLSEVIRTEVAERLPEELQMNEFLKHYVGK